MAKKVTVQELEKRIEDWKKINLDLLAENKKLNKRHIELLNLAYSDVKFGCLNRNWLNQNKKRLEKFPMTVILIDINGLKKINDTKGHDAGDNYILQTISIVKKQFHTKDENHMLTLAGEFIIRLGGDEFLILYEGDNSLFVDNLKTALGDSASVGFHLKNKHESFYIAMKKADEDLYRNKKAFYARKSLTLSEK